MIRRTLITLCLLLPALLWGQNTPADLLALLHSGQRVECGYSYTLRGDFPIAGEGKAVIMGHSYHLSEGGIDTWSDGVTVWSADNSSKEVYIYSSGSDILSHPEAYLGAVQDFRFEDGSLSCSIRDPQQGLDLDFKASGIRISPAGGERFSFDTSSLDSSWIITDLR